MNVAELLSLSAREIADEIMKSNGSKKLLTEFIADALFDENAFDLLVEANEIILIKSANERQRYCDLTLSLIRSKQMWSEQEMRLVDLLASANTINGDTEYYRFRIRELIVSLYEKDVLISVCEAREPMVISEKKKRLLIRALIKNSFPGISSKRIADRI